MDATDELAVPGDIEEGVNFVDGAIEGAVMGELEGVGCAPFGGEGPSGFDGSGEGVYELGSFRILSRKRGKEVMKKRKLTVTSSTPECSYQMPNAGQLEGIKE